MPSTPRSQRNLLGCTARAVENAAPWCLRHIEQWQCPMNSKGASASKATSPHRQLPRTVMVRPPLPPRVRRLGRVALARSRRNGSRTATTSARCRRSSTTSTILRARAQARSGRRPHRYLRHRATIGAARDYLGDARSITPPPLPLPGAHEQAISVGSSGGPWVALVIGGGRVVLCRSVEV